MLFNSYIYILFLPLAVIGYTQLRRRSTEAGLLWLNACSFFFYGWSNPACLPLLLVSISVNYAIGRQLSVHRKSATGNRLLLLGILGNLLTLGYFKYTGFALANLNALFGTQFHDPGIVLPLAISFFTFNQVTYLVDCWEGMAEEYRFNHYCLFVSFFPHLLAGPIVHHRELIPQFRQPPQDNRDTRIACAVTVISFGLFKKTVFADALAYYADQVFAAAQHGRVETLDAWIGALAYNLQIYFDFSAYCDIAYGSALLFGIRLPQNFLSPYKSASIIEYWKRWHMTLGRLITGYVYTPLLRKTPGGISFGKAMVVTVASMTLCGLWHGAGWHFILWGVVHGILLVINHLWRKLPVSAQLDNSKIFHLSSILLTYTAVTASMVLSRAPDLATANMLYSAMANVGELHWGHHLHQPVISDLCRSFSISIDPMWKLLPVMIFLQAWVWLMPNLQQLMLGQEYATTATSVHRSWLLWKPDARWSLLTALAFVAAFLAMYQTGEFIYFQF